MRVRSQIANGKPQIRNSRSARLFLIVAILFWFAPARAWAQGPQEAGVQLVVPQRMYVGEPGQMQVVVQGSRGAEPPDLPALPDCQVVYQGPMESSQTTIAGGTMTTVYTKAFQYQIIARKAGTLEIPPINVMVDGRVRTTNPASITVAEPLAAGDSKLVLSVDHTEAFVGQPVRVRYIWTLGRQPRTADLTMPIQGVEAEVMAGPDSQQAARGGFGGGGGAQVLLNGQPTMAQFDGRTLTIDRVVIPKAAGTITVGPARADFKAVVSTQRDPDFLLFQREVTESQFCAAPAIEVRVKDLPAAGRPADFSGLVGNYAIQASADASEVSVGDPVNLIVAVSGPYPLSLVPPLDMTRQAELKGKFRVAREPVLAEGGPGSAVFRTMVRPRSAEVTEIGAIALSYFDPEAQAYKVAKSAPVKLRVKGASMITLPPEPEEARAPVVAPVRRPGGLPDMVRGGGGGAGGAPMLDVGEEMRSGRTLTMLVAPPAVCLAAAGLIGLKRWRERDPAAARRRAALARLRRALRRAGARDRVEVVAGALANFAADWFDQPQGTLTGPQAAGLLREGGAAGAELAEMLMACDRARFGSRAGGAGAGAMREDAAERVMGAARAFAAEVRG